MIKINQVLIRRAFIAAFFLFSLLHAFPPSLLALNPEKKLSNYILHTWTTKDGLPQDTIYCIVQDYQGFIWIGTDRGLVRFDGIEFKHFNKSNTHALKNDSITTLFIANDKTLWIGTYGGGITLLKNNQFISPASPDALPNHFIQSITEDRENNIWIGTLGGGIIHFDGNLFSAITTDTEVSGLSNNIVSAVHADSKNRLWIGTANGLDCLENGEFTTYTTRNGLLDNNIKTIFEDSKGFLWIGTSAGLNVIRNRFSDLNKSRFHSFTTANGLTNNYIHSINEDRNGCIWIATNGGLNRAKDDPSRRQGANGTMDHLTFEEFTTADGLSDNSLLSVFEDRWGNVWVGTSGGGLNALRDGKFSFYTVRDGLSGNNIKAIYEGVDGSLWIGTAGAGLNRQLNGTFDLYTESDGLSSNNIESLCDDSEGNLWIGTADGLNVFNITDNTFSTFTEKDGISNLSIKTIYRDKKGNMWVGTFGGGLNLYRNGKFHVYGSSSGLSNNFILSIAEDREGNLWVGTNSGLNRFHDGRFDVFTSRDGLSGDIVMDIYADADGGLWIATNGGGVNRYKSGHFTEFKTDIGEFSENMIYRIIEDSRSNLWMSSHQGIYSISRRALDRYAEGRSQFISPIHFQKEDGLKTSVCVGGFQPAGWRTKDGKIWFPTSKGAAMIDLGKVTIPVDELPRGTEPTEITGPVPNISYVVVVREQPVVIDKVLVDDEPIDMKKDYIFPADSEKIEFQFKLLNYTAPNRIIFKYRLVGFDEHWREINEGNRVVYRNVPSGRYTFKVMARAGGGEWVYRSDSYTFFVDQHFYQSFWFYFFVVLILETAIVGIPRLLEEWKDRKEEVEEKYKSSSLSTRQSESYLSNLLTLMETEKPYLDPNLSLQDMAERMGCSKENLSQVINEKTGFNFKNFINKYRVEAAMVKLADPKENQYVLMKIALDVGFNSKSVFNAAFSKFTGMSPSQYRNKTQSN
jgi:ligand-binding sensor domain-containing protein/AraC-like DNA-binding protein